MSRDKRLVAASFSRAARQYDQVAHLQKAVAGRLSAWIPILGQRRVLDLGSGTGAYNNILAQITDESLISLDLAEGMLRFSRERGHRGAFVCGDAEAMPFGDGAFDLIWSSLALQWCEEPVQLFAELGRIVRSGGRVLMSTLGPETLSELRHAWSCVDDYQHVNDFWSIESVLATQTQFSVVRREKQLTQHQFVELGELLRELRMLGAHNLNQDRPKGLGGQSSLRALYAAYEQFRTLDGTLPATYEVHYLELERL